MVFVIYVLEPSLIQLIRRRYANKQAPGFLRAANRGSTNIVDVLSWPWLHPGGRILALCQTSPGYCNPPFGLHEADTQLQSTVG